MGEKLKKSSTKSERGTREGGAEKERNTHQHPKKEEENPGKGSCPVIASVSQLLLS